MSAEKDLDRSSVDQCVKLLERGNEAGVHEMLERDFCTQAEVDAAREAVREKEDRWKRIREVEAENERRGGLSCRHCHGFVAAADADRYGSVRDGHPPPHCETCWTLLEPPLLRDRLRRAGVPRHFLESVLSVGRGAPYSRPSGKWFTLILGPVGVGKTFRAVQFLLDEKEGRFWSLPDLVEARRTAMFSRDENRYSAPLEEAAAHRGLLVLDEVGGKVDDEGKPADREFVAETVRRIVLHRYDNELPTVFTSNWTAEQLEKGYGEKVGSRLAECAHIVELASKTDRRRQRREGGK